MIEIEEALVICSGLSECNVEPNSPSACNHCLPHRVITGMRCHHSRCFLIEKIVSCVSIKPKDVKEL